MKKSIVTISKEGSNSTEIRLNPIKLPTVEEILDLKQSDKGNRTFHQSREAEDVWVVDGGYTVRIMLTVYAEAGSITGDSIAEAVTTKDSILAEDARKISALKKAGYSEAEAIALVKEANKKRAGE